MPWSTIQIAKEEDWGNKPKQSQERYIPYIQAIREALDIALNRDPRVYLIGEGVDDPGGLYGCTKDLHKKYGRERVLDTPLSEAALTGIAAGSALGGMRPVHFHGRPDFLLLAMDQLVNHIAKWYFMFGKQSSIPIVIYAAIGRGWGTGPQHSQSLQALFTHIPGFKVVMPSNPYDAKGLLLSAIADENPVLFFDHRWAMRHSGVIPEEAYFLPFGKGVFRRKGKKLTIVGYSYILLEAEKALENEDWDIEIIDLRTLYPLDEEIILESVKKTGKLLILDTAWKTGGFSAEIAARVSEKALPYLKQIRRLASPDCPVPSGYSLEKEYYPTQESIKNVVKEMLKT